MNSNNGTENDNLEHKYMNVIVALLEQPTVTAAAQQAGISRQTLYRYQKDPVFQKQYLAARKASWQRTTGLLQAATGRAVEVITEVMNRTEAQAGDRTRLSACRAILQNSLKFTDLFDFSEALDEQEAGEQDSEDTVITIKPNGESEGSDSPLWWGRGGVYGMDAIGTE